jgi:hypothetical protein
MKEMNDELTWVMVRWTDWFVELVDSKMVVRMSSRSCCCGDQAFMMRVSAFEMGRARLRGSLFTNNSLPSIK